MTTINPSLGTRSIAFCMNKKVHSSAPSFVNCGFQVTLLGYQNFGSIQTYVWQYQSGAPCKRGLVCICIPCISQLCFVHSNSLQTLFCMLCGSSANLVLFTLVPCKRCFVHALVPCWLCFVHSGSLLTLFCSLWFPANFVLFILVPC